MYECVSVARVRFRNHHHVWLTITLLVLMMVTGYLCRCMHVHAAVCVLKQAHPISIFFLLLSSHITFFPLDVFVCQNFFICMYMYISALLFVVALDWEKPSLTSKIYGKITHGDQAIQNGTWYMRPTSIHTCESQLQCQCELNNYKAHKVRLNKLHVYVLLLYKNAKKNSSQ